MMTQLSINNIPYLYSINPDKNKIIIFTKEDTYPEHYGLIIKYELDTITLDLRLADKYVTSENIFPWHNLHKAQFGKYFNKRLSNIYKLDSFIGIKEADSKISEVLKLFKFTDLIPLIIRSPNDIVPTSYRNSNNTEVQFNYVGELPYYEISPKGNYISVLAPDVRFSQSIEINELNLYKELTKPEINKIPEIEWDEENQSQLLKFINDFREVENFVIGDNQKEFDTLDESNFYIKEINSFEYARDLLIEFDFKKTAWDEEKLQRIEKLFIQYRNELLETKKADEEYHSRIEKLHVINTDAKYYFDRSITLYIKKIEAFITINIEEPIVDAFFSNSDKFLIVRIENRGLVFFDLTNFNYADYQLSVGNKFRCFQELENIENVWFSDDDSEMIVEGKNTKLTLYKIRPELAKIFSLDICSANWIEITKDKGYAFVGFNDNLKIFDLVNSKLLKTIKEDSEFGLLSKNNDCLVIFQKSNSLEKTHIKIINISDLIDLVH